MNQLLFGDNLEILQKLYPDHPQGFIDLIYVDPPFNSNRNYTSTFIEGDFPFVLAITWTVHE